MKDQSTRREFLKTATLKTAALGAGLLIGGEQFCCAQQQRTAGQIRAMPLSPNNPAIQYHRDRCRNCGDCRNFCQRNTTVQGQPVPAGEDACIHCGQCTFNCQRRLPFTERYHYPAVTAAIADPNKIVVASTAPAIRVSLGEKYQLPPGTNVEGKIVGALKQLGVNHVLDATFSADLTIMEEASELLRRLDKYPGDETVGGVRELHESMLQSIEYDKTMPMFTSCCPAWVRFAKLFYPYLLPKLSTVKSPIMMQGALVKTYFAEKLGIDPARIVHIALTPCTAKKVEILLPGMNAAGVSHGKSAMRDVDIALTCREISMLLSDGKVDFLQAKDAPYDSPVGSGAGMIFGNTGGVMESALRTAYKLLNGKNPPNEFLELRPVRGWDNVRQASVDIGKRTLSVAVVHGIAQVRPLIEAIRTGTQKFDFVEVMACSGGCIGGGGQPIVAARDAARIKQQRIAALYQRDVGLEVRLSSDNPQVKAIYGEFLGEPLGKKAEELLHVRKTT
jgi:ferredoxin hydrogenase